MNKKNNRAIVIGGGFAGLTAGHYLWKAGWDVVLLEASDRVGGRVRTERVDGYTLDTGATQMSSGYGEYLALCAELGWTEQMVESSPCIGIARGGKIYSIDSRKPLSGPLSPVISWRSKLKMLNTIRDYLSIKPQVDVLDVSRSHAVDVESAEQYALRRLNPELYETLVDPLVRCYVMMGAKNVTALEWFSTLRNLNGQVLLSLKGGNDRLPKRLAQDIEVHYRVAAQAIDQSEGRVEVRYLSADGSTGVLEADACVLATPLPQALEIYPPSRLLAGSLAQNLYRTRAWNVQLGYRRKPALAATGVLLPTREYPEISLLWLEHNKNPDRAPEGHALFSVYSDEICNDKMLARSDAELIRFATAFVEGLFPELRGFQDMAHLTRWPMAITNPSPGYYKAIAEMQQRIDPRDRVQLAGDYFTCVGQNSAIYYGKKAALNILQA